MTPSQQIDQQIASLEGWRGDAYQQIRQLIHQTNPDMVEAWKWGTAVFVHGSNICAVAAFKDHVKINFFKGATLPDPQGLFNAGLDAKESRAININEGYKIDQVAFQELIRAAI